MVRTQDQTNREHASIGADADSMHALSGACPRRKPSKIKDGKVAINGLTEVSAASIRADLCEASRKGHEHSG